MTHQAPIDTSFLNQYALTYRFRQGAPVNFRVTPDGREVLFLRSPPRSLVRDLFALDPATGVVRTLLTAEALLHGAEEHLTAEERARRERMRLAARGIASFEVSMDGSKILVPLSGGVYVVDRQSGEHRRLDGAPGAPVDPRFSPDGRYVSCVKSGELYVTELSTGLERRLTSGATETLTHGTAEFVAQEEMDRMEGYWWSPDSTHIAYQETDTSAVDQWHISDPLHPENPPETSRYPRAGAANASVRVGLLAVTGTETTWIDWDHARHPYLAKVRWQPGGPLLLLVQNRAQTEELLLAADQAGHTRTLVTESDPAWINIDPSMPHYLSDGSGFLWSSERSGHWQMELRSPDGSLVRTLTSEALGYRHLVHVNNAHHVAFISASDEPTESHLWSVDCHGAMPPERWTLNHGEHTAFFGAHPSVHVRQEQQLGQADQWRVYDANTRVANIASVVEQPSVTTHVEIVRTGQRQMRAAVVRPKDFDPARRYPVLLWVYGGPHAQTVTAQRTRYLLPQWFADQGFVVVSVDGRGTPWRGRLWERALAGELGEVPLADQVEGIQSLGQSLHEMDLNRVGVFGWSFGGYMSAMMTIRRPAVFRAGVSGAPVTDWRDYDTHYTERYLGLPEAQRNAYDRASLLTYTSLLQRPLLVIHGTADDNVFLTHGLKLSDALFRAGRAHEFLPLAGQTHSVTDPEVTERLYGRIANFLREHLGT